MPSDLHTRKPSNPVTRRVATLSNQWLDFASNERARLLGWRLALDELRMLEAFFALELDERTAQHDALFVPFESPFESASGHARALLAELISLYDKEQAGLRAEGVVRWTPPEALESEADVPLFVRCCTSFAACHRLPGHLVLVLTPSRGGDSAAYLQWLLQLAAAAPETLRIIVVDNPSTPAPPGLFEDHGERVVIWRANLNMSACYVEISGDMAGRDAPGNRFRDLFLQLGAALGSNDLEMALQLGGSALAIAKAERWFALAVPVRVALGQALGAAGRMDEARVEYAAAEATALRGQAEGSPEDRESCKPLRLHSRLGWGAALMASKEYAEAACVFGESVPIAVENGEHGMRLDCYRLASLCHELNDNPVEAFRWGYDGLIAAREFPSETLAVSSLPFLGEALLRLCEPAGRAALRVQLERELEILIGKPDWRPMQPPAAESSAV